MLALALSVFAVLLAPLLYLYLQLALALAKPALVPVATGRSQRLARRIPVKYGPVEQGPVSQVPLSA